MIALICVLLFVSGCVKKTALPLNKIVDDILAEKGIKNSKITLLGDFENADNLYNSEKYSKIEITDEELQKFVNDILLIHEEMIEITDRNIVRSGDAIFVSYVVYNGSEMVANAASDSLLVGSGNYFKDFEDAVVGAIVGEPFSCELPSSVDTEKYKKGDILKYNITVQSINYFVTYTSSDQYILDYYGFDNENDFLKDCEMRLIEQKKYESQKQADKDFLNKLVKECEFSIDKEEVAKYSQKIVEQYKGLAYINGLELDVYIEQKLQMTENEFYDYCYNLGKEEIKRYLLIGAYSNDCDDYTNLSNNKQFTRFCSMMGYDSTIKNNDTEYAFLERMCINNLSQTGLYIHNVGYSLPFKQNKIYTVDVYDSSNVYSINFSAEKQYMVSNQVQEKIISHAQNLMFGETTYNYGNNLYDTVIVFKADGENIIKVMVDSKNGFVSMKYYDSKNTYPYIVETELTKELKNLISEVKQ